MQQLSITFILRHAMHTPLVTATFIALTVGNMLASDRRPEFRDAIRASSPEFCGGDMVVRGPLSIRALEEEGLRAVRACAHCPQVPFGSMARKWQKFKQQIRPGDAVVFFHCETKNQRGLLEGYAIIRDGKVWKTFIAAIS
jgi:hypothetical protein